MKDLREQSERTYADKYQLNEQQKRNADVDGVEGITAMDALVLQQLDAGILKLEDLPLNKKS